MSDEYMFKAKDVTGEMHIHKELNEVRELNNERIELIVKGKRAACYNIKNLIWWKVTELLSLEKNEDAPPVKDFVDKAIDKVKNNEDSISPRKKQ